MTNASRINGTFGFQQIALERRWKLSESLSHRSNPMTQTDKLSFIREKCIAANPEIVELKYDDSDNGKQFKQSSSNIVFTISIHGYPRKDIHEILGRPIRLADVLLAIDKKYPGNFATVASNGWFHYGYKRCFYDLRADDLREQSEETINFLYELLR
jgi:hypothetical protein